MWGGWRQKKWRKPSHVSATVVANKEVTQKGGGAVLKTKKTSSSLEMNFTFVSPSRASKRRTPPKPKIRTGAGGKSAGKGAS